MIVLRVAVVAAAADAAAALVRRKDRHATIKRKKVVRRKGVLSRTVLSNHVRNRSATLSDLPDRAVRHAAISRPTISTTILTTILTTLKMRRPRNLVRPNARSLRKRADNGRIRAKAARSRAARNKAVPNNRVVSVVPNKVEASKAIRARGAGNRAVPRKDVSRKVDDKMRRGKAAPRVVVRNCRRILSTPAASRR